MKTVENTFTGDTQVEMLFSAPYGSDKKKGQITQDEAIKECIKAAERHEMYSSHRRVDFEVLKFNDATGARDVIHIVTRKK